MNGETLYQQRLDLIRRAVACQPVDRIPVIPCANAYLARSQHVVLKDYINDFDKACTANLAELTRLDADGTQNVIFSPYLLGTQWLSTTRNSTSRSTSRMLILAAAISSSRAA